MLSSGTLACQLACRRVIGGRRAVTEEGRARAQWRARRAGRGGMAKNQGKGKLAAAGRRAARKPAISITWPAAGLAVAALSLVWALLPGGPTLQCGPSTLEHLSDQPYAAHLLAAAGQTAAVLHGRVAGACARASLFQWS